MKHIYKLFQFWSSKEGVYFMYNPGSKNTSVIHPEALSRNLQVSLIPHKEDFNNWMDESWSEAGEIIERVKNETN